MLPTGDLARLTLLAVGLLLLHALRLPLVWHRRVRQGEELAGLRHHMLRDTGLMPEAVRAERDIWFWRP